ncbi:MAG: sugar ABC transporter permease [Limnochordales bacterium]|nr:sugar ABC transporter permease [Limnochordales bacterium]
MSGLVQRAVANMPVRGRSLWERENVLGSLMLTPAVLYIVLLVGFPFVFAIYLALTDATVGSPVGSFVGLDNFREIIQSRGFRTALKNTFIFTFSSQAIILILANALSMALQRDFRGKGLVTFLILLPWVAPVSLTTISWLWIFHSRFSLIDWFLRQLNLLEGNLFWLGRPDLAMIAIIIVHVWRMFPFATVILLAGHSALPKDVLESAQVDGAGFWRIFFQIRLPLLLPIMSVAVLFSTVFTFSDMTVVYVLTRGGPFDTTHVLSSMAYFRGIFGGNLSVGAAVSLFLFPVLLIAAILILRIARRAEVT